MPSSITMFPANNGDCLLIEVNNSLRFLIDTGYLETYKQHLKPYLINLAESGFKLDFCIITHVDADHIQGAVAGLFPDNKSDTNPQVIEIGEVWHNSYRHLDTEPTSTKSLTASDELVLTALAAKGVEPTDKVLDSTISARQGTSLAAMLLKYNYPWNTFFSNNVVVAPARILISEGVVCHILSPTAEKLRRLSSVWKRELRKHGFKGHFTNHLLFEAAYQSWLDGEKDTVETTENISQQEIKSIQDLLRVPFIQDESITNGSSIALILEFEEKRLLFLADASPDVIINELTIIFPDSHSLNPIWFDCIKVAHHGSFKNNSPDLLCMTDSACYLFSTNGRIHNHPDAETIAWIISRPCSKDIIRKLYFNYRTDTAVLFDRVDWKAKYSYDIIFAASEAPCSIFF